MQKVGKRYYKCMLIKSYEKEFFIDICTLFYETVHSVNAGDYSESQLEAWAPKDNDYSHLKTALEKNRTLVAIEDGMIIGFADIEDTGYLDHLFVHRDYQGKGVATALCNKIEAKGNFNEIETHASITALPFFEKRGYKVVREQIVEIRGEKLKNYVMRKRMD